MMYQVMRPYPQIVGQMQICEPKSVQRGTLPQSNQRRQVLRSNVSSLNTKHAARKEPPMYLPSRVILQTSKSDQTARDCRITRNSSFSNNPVVMFNDAAKSPGDPYSCHFLGQLQGTWQTNALHGVQIDVELGAGSHRKFAIVRRKYTDGTVLSDQHIYAHTTQFTLCSVEGQVMAVMPKGMSMKYSITWFTKNGSLTVWNRKGNVSFRLTATSSDSSRRNSISSENLRSSPMSVTSVGQSGGLSTDVSRGVRPESLQSKGKPTLSHLDLDSTRSNCKFEGIQRDGYSKRYQRLSDDAAFELFQSQCRKHSTLPGKLLNWGTCLTADCPISEVTDGRVWVSVKLIQPTKRDYKKKLRAIIDKWKGPYQEVKSDTYVQPLSKYNEAQVQHRLRKSRLGLYVIEERNFEEGIWSPCVKEHPYGNWIDLNNKGEMYKVQIVPMLNILSRMNKDWSSSEEMRKSVDFLFESHNLGAKEENLQRNINDLSLKLEKEYKLRFAARVDRAADVLAKEMD
jgi:hypothetical protein